MIRQESVESGESRPLPTSFVPSEDAADVDRFIEWVGSHREEILDDIEGPGAVLFRGFGFREPSDFERFSRSLHPVLQSYVGGNSPRHRVAGAVYTSTEYPPAARISLHNEASYLKEIPRWISFYCEHPAESGGQTPLADCRGILAGLRDEVRERFTARKIRYVNNLNGGAGIGRSWQEAFESDDRDVVEERLRAGGYDYQWKPDGGLRTTIVGDAARTHPVTGEEVWINQAEQWHPSSLDPKTREMLGSMLDEEDFPHYAAFGDGSPLPEEDLDHIREVMAAEERVFEWQAGDVLACDNLLVCHGRQPYQGKRRVLVTLS